MNAAAEEMTTKQIQLPSWNYEGLLFDLLEYYAIEIISLTTKSYTSKKVHYKIITTKPVETGNKKGLSLNRTCYVKREKVTELPLLETLTSPSNILTTTP